MHQIHSTQKHIRTQSLRVKDKHAVTLARPSRAVNFVWNYINELSERSIREHNTFLSAYDIHRYTTGASKELGLHSHTVQKVSAAYVQARVQFRKRRLAWRKSAGVRRSLGWVPFNTGHARWRNGQIHFNGTAYGVWDSYGLSGYTLRSGSFSEDSQGRWYFNVAVQIEAQPTKGKRSIGIDLGCKDAATASNGGVLHSRWYRAG
ncbi:MAG: putative transposase [Granulosicoccus sp.]|jgi:putative transposase